MYRRGTHVAWQLVQNEAILVDLSAGNTLGLNATGSIVWQHLEDESVEVLAERVANAFSIDSGTARNDVEAFLDHLLSRGLVTREER